MSTAKKDISDELIIAEQEKAKRAAELVIANEEKAKREAELVIANVEKEKQRAGIAIAEEEKAKRANELVIAEEEKKKREAELVIANEEKAKRVAELIIDNEEKAKRVAELVVADAEKQKRVAELVIADEEKQKRVAELIIDNEEKGKRVIELVIAEEEKAKRVAELVIANEEKQKRVAELIIDNDEKEKRVAELVIAEGAKAERVAELVIANEEKAKRVAELSITNIELHQLLKLNSDKDRFISILAHDLRSPFTALLGISDLLIDNIRIYNIEEIEILLKHIKDASKETFALLEDLLKWTSTQSGEIPFNPQGHSVPEICKNVLQTLKLSAIDKNITLNSRVAEHIFVFADIDMLKTVLRNLVSNAIKFSNSGGVVNISTEQKSDIIIISVSDDGIGIKPEKLANLFDISERQTTTGTAEEKGTGLGLILCKEFVKRNGGRIWAESEFGKGSNFKFALPLFTRQAV
jgi:signal transduction histidine kinase